jgi:hypothetical protein
MSWKFWKTGLTPDETITTEVKALAKPKDMPEPVGSHIIGQMGYDHHWAWKLKTVVRPKEDIKHCFDIRVFDQDEAVAKNAKIANYASLDDYPELIIFEGWYNKKTWKLNIEERNLANAKRAAS